MDYLVFARLRRAYIADKVPFAVVLVRALKRPMARSLVGACMWIDVTSSGEAFLGWAQ
jgi:hypothetical protein